MAKVLYKQGTKATYLGLLERNPSALYFCTDTKELFKGDELYSDGLRIVASRDMLPDFMNAADGVLYFCADTGCGYVLSPNRDEWILVVHGVDEQTIGYTSSGLLYVKAVSIETVVGLEQRLTNIEERLVNADSAVDSFPIATNERTGVVKGSAEIEIAEDGTMSITAIAQNKVFGLEERLMQIEQAILEDASAGYLKKEDIQSLACLIRYEVFSKPNGTLVNCSDDEIRIMCAYDTEWVKQNSGANSDSNMYYIGLKAYAPSDDVISFKEDLAEIISDETMYYFENNDFAGVDEYGRKYSVIWLPVAAFDPNTGKWTYYGEASTEKKFIGWYYSVDWYDADGIKVSADTVKINLTNEECHTKIMPYYLAEVQSTISSMEESYTWGDM